MLYICKYTSSSLLKLILFFRLTDNSWALLPEEQYSSDYWWLWHPERFLYSGTCILFLPKKQAHNGKLIVMVMSSGVFSVNISGSSHALFFYSSVLVKIRPVGWWSVTSVTWRLEKKLPSIWRWSSTPGFSRLVQWVLVRDMEKEMDHLYKTKLEEIAPLKTVASI